MLWSRLYRSLLMSYWFPHVPISLAVGCSGILELLPSFGSVEHFISTLALPTQQINELSRGFETLAIHGVSREIIGELLVILSLGLLWRFRLAWITTILITLTALALQFTITAKPDLFFLVYDSALVALLLATGNHFQRLDLAYGTLFSLIGILLTLGYGVLGSYILGSQFSPNITDFNDALYFTVVTMTTVGYGDISPSSTDARLFTISLIILGLVIFVTSLTAIVEPLINQRIMALLQPPKKTIKRKDHIIVVGDTPLARNAIYAMIDRGMPVAAIWTTRPPEGADVPEDLIIGDGGDTEILRNAGIETARAVLALSANDSDNAFVVLAAKEINRHIRTVVAVSGSETMHRVRHVHPDVILALPVIGGELLAMALSGEEIKADVLVDQLLKLG